MENIEFPLDDETKRALQEELMDRNTSEKRVEEIRLIANEDDRITQGLPEPTGDKPSFEGWSDAELRDSLGDPKVPGAVKDAIVRYLQQRSSTEGLPPES